MRDQNTAKCIRTLSYFPIQKTLKNKRDRKEHHCCKIQEYTFNLSKCSLPLCNGRYKYEAGFFKRKLKAFKLTTLLLSAVAYLETHMQLVGMLTGSHLLSVSSAPQY